MGKTHKAIQLREHIRQIERKLGVLQENQGSCCDITMAQCHALVEIGRAGSISLVKLSETLNLDNSTMSRTVNNLVKKHFVERQLDTKDRRYITIQLTEGGREVFEGIEERMNFYFENVLGAIPEDKQQQVLEGLDILLKALKENQDNK
ncbi:DNA-binding transcriptional regulator, MarR family [Natronincola peptidivorans]|uniref:DNA-binding transcriptional regulator, MarR family n=1 Tax=Natronincola peptidivorans TaxID=426128 RepID=A0A1I0H6R3_9FIRM|nr:MarR family transcriptional regulator [Natronincola peptidivorans]SET79442.1 DNA-binding transcriptional regulator, MarR family [Natronincola peptidivorans]